MGHRMHVDWRRRGGPWRRGRDVRRALGALWMLKQVFGTRRGGFGPGRAWGPHRGNEGGGGGHFFGRGDLKFALLSLLKERPMHGYEMIKELQDRTGGRYQASAGSVYPTLQMLADREFVTVEDSDGKKVYHITEGGRTFLEEHGPRQEDHPGWRDFRSGKKGRGGSHGRSIRHKLHEIGATLRHTPRHLWRDETVIEQVTGLLDRTLDELHTILKNAQSRRDF